MANGIQAPELRLPSVAGVQAAETAVPQIRANAEASTQQYKGAGREDTRFADAQKAATMESLFEMGKAIIAPKVQEHLLNEYNRGMDDAARGEAQADMSTGESIVGMIFGPSAHDRGFAAGTASAAVTKDFAEMESRLPELVASGIDIRKEVSNKLRAQLTGDKLVDNLLMAQYTEQGGELYKRAEFERVKQRQIKMKNDAIAESVALTGVLEGRFKARGDTATSTEVDSAAEKLVLSIRQRSGETVESSQERAKMAYSAALQGKSFHALNVLEKEFNDSQLPGEDGAPRTPTFEPGDMVTLMSLRRSAEQVEINRYSIEEGSPYRAARDRLREMSIFGDDPVRMSTVIDDLNEQYAADTGSREKFISDAERDTLMGSAWREQRDEQKVREKEARDEAKDRREELEERASRAEAARIAYKHGNVSRAIRDLPGANAGAIYDTLTYGSDEAGLIGFVPAILQGRPDLVQSALGYAVASRRELDTNKALASWLQSQVAQGPDGKYNSSVATVHSIYRGLLNYRDSTGRKITPLEARKTFFHIMDNNELAQAVVEYDLAVSGNGDPEVAYRNTIGANPATKIPKKEEKVLTSMLEDSYTGFKDLSPQSQESLRQWHRARGTTESNLAEKSQLADKLIARFGPHIYIGNAPIPQESNLAFRLGKRGDEAMMQRNWKALEKFWYDQKYFAEGSVTGVAAPASSPGQIIVYGTKADGTGTGAHRTFDVSKLVAFVEANEREHARKQEVLNRNPRSGRSSRSGRYVSGKPGAQ